MERVRLPRMVAAAWAVALAVLVALGVAVRGYLRPGTGMAMGTAEALTRGNGGAPTRPLFGTALLTAWQLDAVALAFVVLAATAYLTGTALVPLRSPGHAWPRTRTASFLAGLAVIVLATNGSIAVYDRVLFSAHMLGHLALVMVAPVLLMWGRPLRLWLDAAPERSRQRRERMLTGRVASLLTSPPVALATYTAVIIGSHLTGLMNQIMTGSTWAGQLEHLVYLLAGCQFFALIVGDEAIRWRLGSPARWLLLAIAMAVDTFTGIVLMQGTSAVHLAPSALSVSPLSDTRTGGAIMWFGGDAIMAAVMIVLVIGYLRHVDEAPREQGWLAQARIATFSAHSVPAPSGTSRERQAAAAPGPAGPAGSAGAAGADATADSDPDIDNDEAAREAYNAWLARLDSGR